MSQTVPGIAFLPSLMYGCAVWLWWAPLTVLIAHGLGESRWFGKLSGHAVVVQTLCALAAACLHLQLLVICVHLLVRRWPLLWNAGYQALALGFWSRAVPEILLYLLVWAAGSALWERQKTRAQELETLALRESLTEAKLFALQRQMQPHFLLNTLNSITGLLESGEHQSALEIVGLLSALTKRALTRDLPALVSVTDELETAEAYLAIEQMRFGHRLQVELSIDPRVLNQKMPPFVLQPLVENAVKHSVHHNLDGCVVRIGLSFQDERLNLTVTDNGNGMSSPNLPGSGISLENIQSRLRLLYRGQYHLEMRTPSQGGCEVDVSFPAESLTA